MKKMKIYFLGNERSNKIGGGWSWLKNASLGPWDITMNPEDCDIYFITSVSMLDKVSQIPFGKKKVILRVDNILKDSTNRRLYGLEGKEKITRMEAMKQVAQRADAIVWQSTWAKNYLSPFIGKTKAIQRIIMNGVNQEIFKPDGAKMPNNGSPVYLYVRSSNHDNKGWHVAQYEFMRIFQKNPHAELWIAGRFSPENNEHLFDFFQGENYKYWGFVGDPEVMAMLYRGADYLLFPFWQDCCSNTILESLACNLKIELLTGGNTGGTPEILENYKKYGREWLSCKRMNSEYSKLFEELK